MKIIIKGPLKENTQSLMRKIGYYFQNNSFIRPLSRGGYPRFHLYLKTEGEDLILNLHLDQKRPIYKGTSAHAGEYEGNVVEQEAERIKQIL
ncbi:MAG: hypothetical protein ABIG08_02550 [bacterium]